MGTFTQPIRRPYAPSPSSLDSAGNSSNLTFLGMGDPNLVRVSGGVQTAQYVPPPDFPIDSSSAKETSVIAGRNASNLYLKFDGRYLRLYDRDEMVAEWPGVSGRKNFGSGKDQEKVDYGPMPEGAYDLKQSRYQSLGLKDSVAGLDPTKKRGAWPGSFISWGQERVWADPTPETVANGLTFGRKDMAIHGGWFPGSAGCIDLTGNMGGFAKTFREIGRDLKLYVDYSRPVPP
jgi:hypothetical protein